MTLASFLPSLPDIGGLRRYKNSNMGSLLRTLWFAFTLLLGTASTGKLCAQGALPQKHLEITGRQTLRITYDCAFTWPSEGGSGVFYLPVPPETGAQSIEHFSSSLKGATITDDAEPPHHLLTATLHNPRGDERRVHWQIVVTGQFQTRQLVDGPPPASAPPA